MFLLSAYMHSVLLSCVLSVSESLMMTQNFQAQFRIGNPVQCFGVEKGKYEKIENSGIEIFSHF